MQTVTITVFAALVATALAVPVHDADLHKIIPVLQRTEVRDDVGQFSVSYLSGDGTSVSEQGALKLNNEGTDHVLVKQGSYSYISPEGEQISLQYVADELGFRPQGSHLPVEPVVAH